VSEVGQGSVIFFTLLLVSLYVFIRVWREKNTSETAAFVGFVSGGVSALLILCLLVSVSDTIIRFIYPAPAAVRYLLR
ncbi:hypothetical protein LCGC14_1802490, partial [marine sediment metagenome]